MGSACGKYDREQLKVEAYKKLRIYCLSKARSHQEVKQKLYELRLWKREVEQILADLIENNFVSESEFANAFVKQKVNHNWGVNKIANALTKQDISSFCIKAAMKEISEKEYLENLFSLANKKWQSIKGRGITTALKRIKTANYLKQKGYEPKLIWQVLEKIVTNSA